MDWNIDFELFSAVILLILLISYFSRIRFPNIANKVYGYMITSSFIACILNIANCMILNNFEKEWLISSYIFTIIYLSIIYALTPMLLVYVFTAFSTRYSYSKLGIVLIFIPYMIEFVEIVASPSNDYVFSISLANGLLYKSGILLIYGINTFYLLCFLVSAIRYHKKIPAIVMTSIVLYVFFSIGNQILQYNNYTNWQLTGCVTSVCFLILFFSIHNPTIMIDESLNIFNKKALTEILEINIENKLAFHVITVSIDNINLINDTFGVSNGDEILGEVCKFLKKLAPKKRLYRYSNDCFTFIIPKNGNYHHVVEEITERFSDVWTYNDISCKITATTSIITSPDYAGSCREIYDLIEFTLAELKTLEKGSIICSDAYLKTKMNRSKRIEVALSNAIENYSFDVYYQPIYNIKEKRFTGAEALIRLYDSELGAIPPEEFISVAEKNGSIIEIGRIVLEKACQFIAKNRPDQYGFEFISVNLSVVQCMQNGIIEYLESVLDKYHISKKMIHFEITETVTTNSMSLFQELLNKMSRRGFHLTLDDYGSGYSTLSYIMHLPFNTIKLDKTLIDDACENIRSKTIVDYTINMLQKLQVSIIAEGAEVTAQVDMLERMGCNYIQGFYFSRPLKSNDFITLIKQGGKFTPID